jgi:hypothetical protein
MTEQDRQDSPPHRASRPRFGHVILTRFNVRYVQDPNAPSIGTDSAWLADRFALFERYCVPSVMAQTEQNFSWLLFFDRATPEPYAERARALAERRPGTTPVFCETLPTSLVRDSIRRLPIEPPQWLLTSRLDNDDGIHAEFVATVQEAQKFDEAEVLNCPDGVILRGDRTYRRRDLSNAFISLSEPYPDFQTVFSITRHIYAGESYPLRQLRADPLWLQVIHSTNISNRVRGLRIPLTQAAPGFPPLAERADGRTRENAAAILAENLTFYLVRSFRDFAVAKVRRLARLFGVDLRRKAVPRGKPIGSRQ